MGDFVEKLIVMDNKSREGHLVQIEAGKFVYYQALYCTAKADGLDLSNENILGSLEERYSVLPYNPALLKEDSANEGVFIVPTFGDA